MLAKSVFDESSDKSFMLTACQLPWLFHIECKIL